ncbi:hypothetical protein [uncultured Mucilaginibacter sp.]|uniref:hypothetical protein n=1 Tax=uncultured Mucilaginibacter sp. TaxID=797541 RepID=UPI0026107DA6|nr:hypothetical protein [uncultured Mucilaginibacter sp.]
MYSPFSASAPNLKIIRTRWFRANFKLTDGKATYGELVYPYFFSKKAVVKTASASWVFRQKFFSRTISITDENSLNVGELRMKWFGRSAKLHLKNGPVFSFTRPWFFIRQYFWLDNQQEQIASLKPHFFSRTIDVSFGKNLQSDTLPLLLVFLGTHLIVLKRRRRAAAAH